MLEKELVSLWRNGNDWEEAADEDGEEGLEEEMPEVDEEEETDDEENFE